MIANALHSFFFLVPRVVGRGGAGLDKLRSAGVEVEVVGRRESNGEFFFTSFYISR